MEQELSEYINCLMCDEISDEFETFNLSTLQSILSYTSIEYRLLKGDVPNIVRSSKKINGNKLTNILFAIGRQTRITLIFENGKVVFTEDKSGCYYEGLSLEDVKKLFSEKKEYIKKTFSILKNVTIDYHSTDLETYHLEDVKTRFQVGNLVITINALGEYDIKYKNKDITDENILKTNIDVLFESITVDVDKLNPVFSSLYEYFSPVQANKYRI